MAVPSLILVGANKGGVGKTMMTRLLIDYLAVKATNYRVYDGQSPAGSVKRFYPIATVVDSTTTEGQMQVLDGVSKAPVTIVDLPAGTLTATLTLLRDLRVLYDVASKRMRLIVLHALGPSTDSLLEAAEVSAALADGGLHYLVKNCVNDERFEWEPGTHKWATDSIAPAGILNIPHMNGTARERVDKSAMDFTDFTTDEQESFVLRRLVSKWLTDCYTQLDGCNLKAVLQPTA